MTTPGKLTSGVHRCAGKLRDATGLKGETCRVLIEHGRRCFGQIGACGPADRSFQSHFTPNGLVADDTAAGKWQPCTVAVPINLRRGSEMLTVGFHRTLMSAATFRILPLFLERRGKGGSKYLPIRLLT